MGVYCIYGKQNPIQIKTQANVQVKRLKLQQHGIANKNGFSSVIMNATEIKLENFLQNSKNVAIGIN